MSSQDVYDQLSRVRRPQQDRSRLAQFAALDAFETLLRERPLHKVTVQEVADRAGLSITSVYARFDGKKALVLALHERVIHEAVERLTSIIGADSAEDAPVEDVIAAVVTEAIQFAEKNLHVFRAVISACDDETNERAASFVRAASGRLGLWLAGRIDGSFEEVDRNVDHGWRSVMAVLQQTWALGGAEPARYPLDDTALAVRLTRQFLAAIDYVPNCIT